MPKDVSRLAGNKVEDLVEAKASSASSAAQTGRIKAKEPIPLSKTPKRQRSSRFHIAERVELEKLVGFNGAPCVRFSGNAG